MSKHDNDTCPHLVRASLLEAENARLKAEVRNCYTAIRVKDEENARLKAEVERLTFDPLTYLDDQGEWMPRHTHLVAVERLEADVERLRKAGDEMADEYRRMCKGEPASGWFHRLMAGNEEFTIEHLEAWNAAKDGKPSV